MYVPHSDPPAGGSPTRTENHTLTNSHLYTSSTRRDDRHDDSGRNTTRRDGVKVFTRSPPNDGRTTVTTTTPHHATPGENPKFNRSLINHGRRTTFQRDTFTTTVGHHEFGFRSSGLSDHRAGDDEGHTGVYTRVTVTSD